MVSTVGKSKGARFKSQNTNKHRQSFPVIVERLIEEADIILEILDARFAEKTRNTDAERKVIRLKKPIIYVLNKADLVDINAVLREVDLGSIRPNVFFSARERKGASQLRKLIKIESQKLGKSDVSVGIIGYPNTGKSSLINLLAGRRSARVSPQAGHTKGIQKIKISTGLYLIDTPGVIPPKEKTLALGKSKHSQIGAINWDKVKEPDMVVFRLMSDYPGVLEKHYGIKTDGNSEVLIDELGKRLHYIQKGNEVDEMRTAKQILRDWQEGKINPYPKL